MDTSHYVLTVVGIDNVSANENDTAFTIKDTKSYVPVVTWSAKDNQKLLKLLRKGFEISKYWKEYKTKIKDKNMTTAYRYSLEWNFTGDNKIFVYFIQIKITFRKGIKAKGIVYQKVLLRIITSSLMMKLRKTSTHWIWLILMLHDTKK